MAIVNSRPSVDVVERLYTAADVASLPPELPSGTVIYELDNGRLLTMVPPGDIHGSVELKIAAALYSQGEQRGHGKARCGDVGIVLWRDPDRVVGADAAFIANESLPVLRSSEGYLETIPDLIVEVRSRNDTQAYIERKISDYLQAGVKQVWIADPQTKEMTIHRRDDKPCVLGEADILRLDDMIPGFELKIVDVFAD